MWNGSGRAHIDHASRPVVTLCNKPTLFCKMPKQKSGPLRPDFVPVMGITYDPVSIEWVGIPFLCNKCLVRKCFQESDKICLVLR